MKIVPRYADSASNALSGVAVPGVSVPVPVGTAVRYHVGAVLVPGAQIWQLTPDYHLRLAFEVPSDFSFPPLNPVPRLLDYRPLDDAGHVHMPVEPTEDDDTPDALENLPPCSAGWRAVVRACGARVGVPVGCGRATCPYCERRRARRLRRKWGGVIERMRHAKMLTLTRASTTTAAAGVEGITRAWRALLDMRAGDDAINSILADAVRHVRGLSFEPEKCAGLIVSCERWAGAASRANARRRARGEADAKIRHVLGRGLRVIEATYKAGASAPWHIHVHVVMDSQYIPWPVLAVLWARATGEDAAVLDIRQIKGASGVREVLKYISRPDKLEGAIPDACKAELDAALKGAKRVFPFGGLEPDAIVCTCPACGGSAPARRARRSGILYSCPACRAVVGRGERACNACGVTLCAGRGSVGLEYHMGGGVWRASDGRYFRVERVVGRERRYWGVVPLACPSLDAIGITATLDAGGGGAGGSPGGGGGP